MYGESYGTATLSRALVRLASYVDCAIDNGEHVDDYIEDAKSLMEGAIVLWETLVERREDDV